MVTELHLHFQTVILLHVTNDWTMQLYILYRLLFYRWRHWSVVVVLMVGCWLWQFLYLDDMETLERLRYNLVGGMLPFGLGVLAGRWPLNMGSSPTVHFPVLVISIVLIILMCFNIQSWLFVPALIVVGTIALVKLIPSQVMPYIVWLGSVSAAIFVTHPIVRKIFVRPYIYQDMYAGLLLYIVATLLLSWLMKKIIDQIPSPKL